MRRPLLGIKLFPSSSLGEQNRDVSAALCSSGGRGGDQSRAATVFCVGSFPPRVSSNEFTITLLTTRFT